MEYILDTDKWRCGKSGEKGVTTLGKGITRLLNEEGYMCCLGQFSEQAGVPRVRLLNHGIPRYAITVPVGCSAADCLNDREHAWLASPGGSGETLISKCIDINDSDGLSVAAKIKGLSELLEKNGHTLKVVGAAHLE